MTKAIRTGAEEVFPDEVEVILRFHPNIVDAAVVGVNDARLGQRLVALVQPTEGATISYEDVAKFCTGRLPGFRVPKEIICVDEIRTIRTRYQLQPDYDWANEVA